jgi:hypothetical protein
MQVLQNKKLRKICGSERDEVGRLFRILPSHLLLLLVVRLIQEETRNAYTILMRNLLESGHLEQWL